MCTTQFVVVSVQQTQSANLLQKIPREFCDGIATKVNCAKAGQGSKSIALHTVQMAVRQVESVEGWQVNKHGRVQLCQVDTRQVHVLQVGKQQVCGVHEHRHQRVTSQTARVQGREETQVVMAEGCQQVVAEVKAVQVRQRHIVHVLQSTAGQTKVNQQLVAGDVHHPQSAAVCLQVTQLGDTMRGEGLRAEQSQPETRAARGTGKVTEQFIVSLGALRPSVTEVRGVQADPGAPAAVIAGTQEAGALRLVLPVTAVPHPVTAHVDRQAVVVTLALEVGVGVRGAVPRGQGGAEAVSCEGAAAVKVDGCRGRLGVDYFVHFKVEVARRFVTTVCAVLFFVA